jgi:hypothetical protein
MWKSQPPFGLLLSSCLLLAACDGAGPDPAPLGLTGDWRGTAAVLGVTYTFEMGLVEGGTAVTGTGTLSWPAGSATYTVDGTYTEPHLQLRFEFRDRPPMNFSGRMADARDRIDGQVAGAGFGGEALALARL